MRRIVLSLVLVFATSTASAAWNRSVEPVKGDPERIGRSRHYIVPASQELREGMEAVQPLGGGRQLVRVAPGISVDASFERLTAGRKIDRQAVRAAVAGKPFIGVTVQFHDDVPFEAAREVIASAGGTVADPLQHEFDVATRVRARIPSAGLLDLAADERVLIVFGPRKLRAALDNLNSANLMEVTPLHAAPYDLTGAGVVLSFFEFAPADATHPEFQGRLTTHLDGADSGDIAHATHVAGTMIAAGIEASAIGMAPRATLHQFSARGDETLNRKEDLPSFSVVADNNSWGYVLGWCGPPSCESWTWDDTEEYYGAYDSYYVAPMDRVARSTNILFVHSAGNDGNKSGPSGPSFSHKHTDDEGEVITGTFCYSTDGSGNDCAAPCSTGNAPGGTPYCESARHPVIIDELPVPYGSIGLTASGKNNVAVGAISTGKFIGSFSSRGPTRDGRVKPDVVARGLAVYSTVPNSRYENKQGTSMASPAVTGISALLVEQWRRTYAGQNPGGAVLKTLLVAGAEDLGTPGPDYTYGFGMVNAKNSVDLIIADGGAGERIRRDALNQGAAIEVPVTVPSMQNLRIVLNWADPEVIIFPSDGLATAALVNDLDVKVITPSGDTVLPYVLDKTEPDDPATRAVNTLDNTEMVEIANAAPGTYTIVVAGTRITAQAPQQFVLVSNADMTAVTPCVDEANNSAATASRITISAVSAGRACAAGDVDYFTFTANQPGPISITVTATDTALRATLTGGSADMSIDVPAGQARLLLASHGSTTQTEYFLRVEPIGTIGTDTSYTITADYPYNPGARRRAVGR